MPDKFNKFFNSFNFIQSKSWQSKKIHPNPGSDKISEINVINKINGQNRCNQKSIGVIQKNKSEIEIPKSELKNPLHHHYQRFYHLYYLNIALNCNWIFRG
ncbi:hypothetical protein HYN43_004260 [Mucilaginibacter celer]|uniref:Uncharacterized protein n=1 Tax=Mucilaginibacter celer TaxID=2305508 RepID=A0A494VNG8_9SPHI|nr:hypothetical protein HYN43_004260 [Mucilaginibacter celer]